MDKFCLLFVEMHRLFYENMLIMMIIINKQLLVNIVYLISLVSSLSLVSTFIFVVVDAS